MINSLKEISDSINLPCGVTVQDWAVFQRHTNRRIGGFVIGHLETRPLTGQCSPPAEYNRHVYKTLNIQDVQYLHSLQEIKCLLPETSTHSSPFHTGRKTTNTRHLAFVFSGKGHSQRILSPITKLCRSHVCLSAPALIGCEGHTTPEWTC